jgi:hypothetical protein
MPLARAKRNTRPRCHSASTRGAFTFPPSRTRHKPQRTGPVAAGPQSPWPARIPPSRELWDPCNRGGSQKICDMKAQRHRVSQWCSLRNLDSFGACASLGPKCRASAWPADILRAGVVQKKIARPATGTDRAWSGARQLSSRLSSLVAGPPVSTVSGLRWGAIGSARPGGDARDGRVRGVGPTGRQDEAANTAS